MSTSATATKTAPKTATKNATPAKEVRSAAPTNDYSPEGFAGVRPAGGVIVVSHGGEDIQLPLAQVRILRVLARAKHGLNRQSLSERAWVHLTHIMGFTETQYATKRTPALVELGLAKSEVVRTEDYGHSERFWSITAKGRKALEQLKK